jgi:iron-sulfur cluster assembly protein
MHGKNLITITPRAAKEIHNLIEANNDDAKMIRISIKSGGCSGYSYLIEYAKNKSDFDDVINMQGVNLLIDKKAILFLIGSEMDYIDETFKSGFVFNNPKEKARCGCGKSFAI